MSAIGAVGMSPQTAALTAMLEQQQAAQTAAAVAAQLKNQTGGAVAPLVSASITAPGALEIFA